MIYYCHKGIGGKRYADSDFFDLSEEKRNRILSAARKVFAFAPYEKVTIQSIIEAADIPRGSFYQYFTDKDDLYLYCQKETLKKTLRITYGENMDYFWNVLRSETPEKRGELLVSGDTGAYETGDERR